MKNRKKTFWPVFLFLSLLAWLFSADFLFGANIATFSITPAAINFPDLDPDLYPEVTATANLRVTFWITGLPSSQSWRLEMLANSGLTSGSSIIAIGNVRWEVTPVTSYPNATYQNSNFTQGVYMPVGTGTGGGFLNWAYIVCDITFYLNNDWTYNTGNYTCPINVRLTVPGDVGSLTFNLATLLNMSGKLVLAYTNLNFDDYNPDLVTSIPARENPCAVASYLRVGASQTSRLTLQATSDLTRTLPPVVYIPASTLSWQASGSGYTNGIVSRTTPQTVGQWTGSGQKPGNLNFFFANSWNYNPGTYTTNVNLILSAL